jgi:hypothetical protein
VLPDSGACTSILTAVGNLPCIARTYFFYRYHFWNCYFFSRFTHSATTQIVSKQF